MSSSWSTFIQKAEGAGNKVITYGLCRNATEVKMNTVGLTIGRSHYVVGSIHCYICHISRDKDTEI